MPRSIVSCATLGLVAACASVPRQTKVMADAGVEMSTNELRQRVYELGNRQEGLIEEAVARIHAGSTDGAIRRAAVTWGLAAVPAVEEATLRPEPLVAAIDLWALALQTRTWARDGPGRARLGQGWTLVDQAARDMASESEELAALLLGADGAGRMDELRRRVERWTAENPVTSPTFARPSASVAWSRAFAEQSRGPVGSFLVATDERLAILSQRIAMLNGSLTMRLRWTLDLMVEDSLGRENAGVLLEEGIRELSGQRRAFAADFARERAEVFEQLERERRVIDTELNAVVDRTDVHANAIVDRMDAQANALLDRTEARARAVVDHLLLGLALVGAALVLLSFALGASAAWILRHGARKRPPQGRVGEAVVGSRPT